MPFASQKMHMVCMHTKQTKACLLARKPPLARAKSATAGCHKAIPALLVLKDCLSFSQYLQWQLHSHSNCLALCTCITALQTHMMFNLADLYGVQFDWMWHGGATCEVQPGCRELYRTECGSHQLQSLQDTMFATVQYA